MVRIHIRIGFTSCTDVSLPPESIPTASKALQTAGQSQNIIFSISDDATQFNVEKLAEYDAILFMMTTDNDTNPLLDGPQQEAFQKYLDSGGHYVGIHGASDCLHGATFYGREVGAYMADHSAVAEFVSKFYLFKIFFGVNVHGEVRHS